MHICCILTVLNEINYNTIWTMLSFTHLNPPHLIYCVFVCVCAWYGSTMNEKIVFWRFYDAFFPEFHTNKRDLPRFVHETIHTPRTFFTFRISLLHSEIARMKRDFFCSNICVAIAPISIYIGIFLFGRYGYIFC